MHYDFLLNAESLAPAGSTTLTKATSPLNTVDSQAFESALAERTELAQAVIRATRSQHHQTEPVSGNQTSKSEANDLQSGNILPFQITVTDKFIYQWLKVEALPHELLTALKQSVQSLVNQFSGSETKTSAEHPQANDSFSVTQLPTTAHTQPIKILSTLIALVEQVRNSVMANPEFDSNQLATELFKGQRPANISQFEKALSQMSSVGGNSSAEQAMAIRAVISQVIDAEKSMAKSQILTNTFSEREKSHIKPVTVSPAGDHAFKAEHKNFETSPWSKNDLTLKQDLSRSTEGPKSKSPQLIGGEFKSSHPIGVIADIDSTHKLVDGNKAEPKLLETKIANILNQRGLVQVKNTDNSTVLTNPSSDKANTPIIQNALQSASMVVLSDKATTKLAVNTESLTHVGQTPENKHAATSKNSTLISDLDEGLSPSLKVQVSEKPILPNQQSAKMASSQGNTVKASLSNARPSEQSIPAQSVVNTALGSDIPLSVRPDKLKGLISLVRQALLGKPVASQESIEASEDDPKKIKALSSDGIKSALNAQSKLLPLNQSPLAEQPSLKVNSYFDGELGAKETTIQEQKLARITQLVESLHNTKVDKPSGAARQDSSSVSQVPFSHHLNPSIASATVAKVLPPVFDIAPEMQNASWNRAFNSRVTWMANEGIQQASLKLNPKQLGSVDVKIHIQNEQINLSFTTQTPLAKETLEQALPKLRESFSEQGLDLLDVDVSERDSEQENEQETETTTNSNQNPEEAEAVIEQDNSDDASVSKTSLHDEDRAINIYA